MIRFEIDGKKIDPGNVTDAITAQIIEGIKDHIHKRIGALRHPVTGESPVVIVRGKFFDNLSVEIEGSSEFVELVQQKLIDDNSMATNTVSMNNAADKEKIVFLCHGSEDKAFARKLANDLTKHGIKVFFDEWEIGPGDSIRGKIDAGLAECTHFIVVLTPTSINKPWVNIEIDSAFIQHVEKSVVFIPIRLNLSVDSLSPLLRSKHSPSFDEYEDSFKSLLSTIYEVSKKPDIGPVPSFVQRKVEGTGLSVAAEAIVRIFIERSETGYEFDPLLSSDEVRALTSLIDDDIIDALDELEGAGFVRRHHALGEGEIGFIHLTPENELFVKFDSFFKDYWPEKDALSVAADLVNNNTGLINIKQLALTYGWQPRRMNPAVNYLINRQLVATGNEMGSHPWVTFWIRKIPATRRFVMNSS